MEIQALISVNFTKMAFLLQTTEQDLWSLSATLGDCLV